MPLKPQAFYKIPEETARVANIIFPKGNAYIRLYDSFGPLFEDQDFAALYPKDGQPAASPARLAMVSVLQFIEGLTDRQAAEAVRTRLDWKFLLALEITDLGFHHTVFKFNPSQRWRKALSWSSTYKGD